MPKVLRLFIDDKNGDVASIFTDEDTMCVAWHEKHNSDPEMLVIPETSGLVFIMGGDFDDALDVLMEYMEMTEEKLISVHSLSDLGNRLLPSIGMHPDMTDNTTLIVNYEEAA